jgi:hypothetical protein
LKDRPFQVIFMIGTSKVDLLHCDVEPEVIPFDSECKGTKTVCCDCLVYPIVWTAVNWAGGKSMARAALDWAGCNIGFGRPWESWPATTSRGGTVLVYFLKKERRMGEEKQGQTKPKIWQYS